MAAGLEGVLALAHLRVTQGSSLARMLGCASLQSQQDMENQTRCPHNCPLMCLAKDCCYCSYSSVHNHPDNPSSDPVPHLNEGSDLGWGRLRESKISAELFPALTKAAHHAWGEALWVRLGEKELAGSGCRADKCRTEGQDQS